jgi:hypothetical protein
MIQQLPGGVMYSLFLRSLGPLAMTFSAAAWSQPANIASPPAAAGGASEQGEPKNGQPREDALELARLLNPAEPLVEMAGRSFDQAFRQGLSQGGETAALEKEHPGLVAELRKATRDVVLADLQADMPALHRRYARFFSDQFTPAETAELISFYRSPTGAKIIAAKFANVDVSGLIDKVTGDPNAKVSTGDIEAMNKGAVSAMWKGMTADDVRSVLSFGLRPVARKLQAAAPAMAQIETEIANEADPALDAAIEQATQKVYERFGLEE